MRPARIVFRALLLAMLAATAARAADVKTLPGVTFDKALADKLPDRVRASGVLKIATDAQTPPITFLGADGSGIIGIDADLAAAIGIVLGVKVEMSDLGAGAAIVPAIKSGRYDVSISGINDDPELEKQLDVIDYMYDATTIMVQRGNPRNIQAMADLCGKQVAVPVGTFQERMVEAESAKCATPIDITTIPRMPDVLAAVRSGRADATVNGYATSVYTTEHQVQKGVGLQALPDIRLAVGYLGMLTRKDDAGLRDAVTGALRSLVESGAYGAIMGAWGLAPLSVKAIRVNDAASLPVE
jgi:polar amino acid transport system substrate-binding protein